MLCAAGLADIRTFLAQATRKVRKERRAPARPSRSDGRRDPTPRQISLTWQTAHPHTLGALPPLGAYEDSFLLSAIRHISIREILALFAFICYFISEKVFHNI
jgi:hypothetical protein